MFGIGPRLFGDVAFGFVDPAHQLRFAGAQPLDLAGDQPQIRPHLILVETSPSTLEPRTSDGVGIDAVGWWVGGHVT